MYAFRHLPNVGIVMIVGLFPQVDQFRWIAWFEVVAGVLSTITTVLLFREPLPLYLTCGLRRSLPTAKEVLFENENHFRDQMSKQSVSLGTILVSFYLECILGNLQ